MHIGDAEMGSNSRIELNSKFLQLFKVLSVVIVLTATSIGVSVVSGMKMEFDAFWWHLLSSSLIVGVLSYFTIKSKFYGVRLFLTILFVFFGIYTFNTQIEAVFFRLDIPREEVFKILVSGFFTAFLSAILLVMTFGKHEGLSLSKTPSVSQELVLRVILCDFVYIILYIVAGMIVFPYVREFYTTLPDISQILFVQTIRGLVYIGLGLLVIYSMGGRISEIAITLGLIFSVLGGIAPLLLPNPYMPFNIRIVHLVEIGVSNFVFGAIVGFVFRDMAE